MKHYNHQEIEPKWQKIWDATPEIYQAVDNDPSREKYYVLVEFPYPSGDGLHIGHVRSYTAQDVVARRARMMGKNVLYPIGWDAFGLPTENYAIKHKIRPQDATAQNVATFKRQIKNLGISFDWSREVNTTDPDYYKWTQWIFLQLYKKGLAYQAEMPINWCPKERVGLANEEVVGGLHERCGTPVEKKILKQWMLRITKYADRLIDGLKDVDYLDQIIASQINWIGKSHGALVDFKVVGIDDVIQVFTTRIDTLFSGTFVVLAPEHPLVKSITTAEQKDAVAAYLASVANKSDLDRQEDNEKSGVFTGAHVINPATGEQIPVWIADFVLGGYGTGAVFADGHDERDVQFANKYDIPLSYSIYPEGGLEADAAGFTGDGVLFNSAQFDGMKSAESRSAITKWLEERNLAKTSVQFKLRDWVFSRQHYWGEPIPIVHCTQCGIVPVPESDLPITLPDVEAYEPTETGESPLAIITDWVNTTCPKCGGAAKRETDTMPNWAGSSWYYLRYIDPHNNEAFASADKLKYWLPVDLYNGGMEHTTLHLLYSRFWHQFLYDEGLVPTPEPYAMRRSHGMILAADGKKMSKSLGNVINPDDMVQKYGADATRLYEMFMGPYDQSIGWSEDKLAGVYRFLRRAWDLSENLLEPREAANPQPDGVFETAVDRACHKALKKLDDQLNRRSFNTAVSTLMELVNFLTQEDTLAKLKLPEHAELSRRVVRILTLMLAPLTPHVTEELWHNLGETGSVHQASWPKYDPALVKDNEVVIIVQVNGKLRGEFIAPAGLDQAALADFGIEENSKSDFVRGAMIVKTISVPNKLVNFVVK